MENTVSLKLSVAHTNTTESSNGKGLTAAYPLAETNEAALLLKETS
jgi:hypothetical protein